MPATREERDTLGAIKVDARRLHPRAVLAAGHTA
jgi:hypothetical protein